jgi:hypothetical protein
MDKSTRSLLVVVASWLTRIRVAYQLELIRTSSIVDVSRTYHTYRKYVRGRGYDSSDYFDRPFLRNHTV